MLSVNTASKDLSKVIQSGWKRSSSSSKATLQSTTSSASAAVKHVAVLRNLCPEDVDVERAAVSILGKLVVLELVRRLFHKMLLYLTLFGVQFDLAMIALAEMHPALCRLIKIETDTQGTQSALHLLMIPKPPSLPTNPIVLTLISTYLLHALIIHARPGMNTINALATTLNSPNSTSLLAWVPSLTSLPIKHMDSLLTRAYTSLTKLASSPASNPKTHLKSTSTVDASPESIFILRMYALRCLIHTSSGTVETNMVWDQVARFTSIFVKAAALDVALEERCTTVVLTAYADLVESAEKRPDRDTFMAIDQKGKGFLAFCENWMEFTRRVSRSFYFL
jgi:separase